MPILIALACRPLGPIHCLHTCIMDPRSAGPAKKPVDDGVALVIQNNWITGNHNKIGRARAYGHWYLLDSGTCKIPNAGESLEVLGL